jgi:catechol 2,3-dioxygenase-like lactoylglutathione lyase family enzyme
LKFYREALGFEEVGRFEDQHGYGSQLVELDDVRMTAVYLERDGWRIELLHFTQPEATGSDRRRPLNQLGLTHLSFVVDDLDQTLAEVERLGGHVVRQTLFDRGTRAIFVTDPDGIRIELIQREGDPLAIPGQ